jgi:hypothetical protein
LLEVVRGVQIAASTTKDEDLPRKSGTEVADELGGRYLVRYLLSHQLGRYLKGSPEKHFVTPTSYKPDEAVTWLALPLPGEPRPYVILLKPEPLTEVRGPRWVNLGGGIEYILPNGFPDAALVMPWELRI